MTISVAGIGRAARIATGLAICGAAIQPTADRSMRMPGPYHTRPKTAAMAASRHKAARMRVARPLAFRQHDDAGHGHLGSQREFDGESHGSPLRARMMRVRPGRHGPGA